MKYIVILRKLWIFVGWSIIPNSGLVVRCWVYTSNVRCSNCIEQLLVILFIIKLNILKRFYYKFCQSSANDYFLFMHWILWNFPSGCFLVYSSNFKELSLTATFEGLRFSLFTKFYKILVIKFWIKWLLSNLRINKDSRWGSIIGFPDIRF